MFIDPFSHDSTADDSLVGVNAQCDPFDMGVGMRVDQAVLRLERPEQSRVQGSAEAKPGKGLDTTCGLMAQAWMCELHTPARPRLLVVDDDPINLHTMYGIFSEDHQMLMANNGERALALCASHPPDLVLLDMMMPGMDGEEVCRRLKADEATSHIPIIFVTSRTSEEAETLALDLGAADFISKPVIPKVVRARVKTQITLKRQSDILRQWCYVDALTEVKNRRCFDESLKHEYARAARSELPLSVIMLDLDFFKSYNDHYGHLAGDACLKRVAGAMKSVLQRPGDLMARYGGEEFACLLPETTQEGAMMIAERLRQQVQGLQIEHAASNGAKVMTVSVGVCSAQPGKDSDSAVLLRTADEQLYAAKEGGRNQVKGTLI